MELVSIMFLLSMAAAGLVIGIPVWAAARRRRRDDTVS
jgi:hypothetical protein